MATDAPTGPGWRYGPATDAPEGLSQQPIRGFSFLVGAPVLKQKTKIRRRRSGRRRPAATKSGDRVRLKSSDGHHAKRNGRKWRAMLINNNPSSDFQGIMRQRQRTPDGRRVLRPEQFPNFFSASCGVFTRSASTRPVQNDALSEHGKPGRTDRLSKVREVEKAFIEAAALCREGVYDQARVEVRSREIPQWL